MRSPLEEWPRRHYVPGGKNPFLFYVVYGRLDTTKIFSRETYRSDGIPSGIEAMTFGPTAHPEQVAVFREGYIWDELSTSDPGLADGIAAQDSCLVLRGEVIDPPTLDYFRDVIGVLTYCLDAGGVAIYDPQMFKYWAPTEWRSRVFDVRSSVPRHHVVILVSADADGTEWIHTRGMRKFGRPDLSIHNVDGRYKDSIVELCNRFIELLAFGSIVLDGQGIRIDLLPPGMTCFLKGSEDDPDFNNEHIEILWPGEAESNV
jgi:hypothetical protein